MSKHNVIARHNLPARNPLWSLAVLGFLLERFVPMHDVAWGAYYGFSALMLLGFLLAAFRERQVSISETLRTISFRTARNRVEESEA